LNLKPRLKNSRAASVGTVLRWRAAPFAVAFSARQKFPRRLSAPRFFRCLLHPVARRTADPLFAFQVCKLRSPLVWGNAHFPSKILLGRLCFPLEGYGCDPEVGLVTEYACCVAEEGNVVDSTWRQAERCQYFGIAFNSATVARVLGRTGVYGLLDTARWRKASAAGRGV